jgi:hypothetical protein
VLGSILLAIKSIKNMESLFKSKTIEISYDSENQFMYCNWIGFQNKDSIMKSGGIILELFKEKQIAKVLNDNRLVAGSRRMDGHGLVSGDDQRRPQALRMDFLQQYFRRTVGKESDAFLGRCHIVQSV